MVTGSLFGAAPSYELGETELHSSFGKGVWYSWTVPLAFNTSAHSIAFTLFDDSYAATLVTGTDAKPVQSSLFALPAAGDSTRKLCCACP